jgi:hypothetical protein
MKCKDVLIIKTDKRLTWAYPVTVTRNHNPADIIGEAWIYEDEGAYYADLEPLSVNPDGLYPSIRSRDGVIHEVGLCDRPNEDPRIKAIGAGNSYTKGVE